MSARMTAPKLLLAARIEEMLRLGWRQYTLQGAEMDWAIEALRALPRERPAGEPER